MPASASAHLSGSDDDDAPETFSLTQTRRTVKGQEKALHDFRTSEKSKRKEKNKARDRRLKEQAESAKVGNGRKAKAPAKPVFLAAEDEEESVQDGEDEEGGEQADLLARMKRAMDSANAEEGTDDDEAGSSLAHSHAGDDDGASSSSENAAEDETMFDISPSDAEDADSDDGSDAELPSDFSADEDTDAQPASNPNHLPDHLFAAAFASDARRPAVASAGVKSHQAHDAPPRKRRRTGRSGKDIVVGARAVRVLPSAAQGVIGAAQRTVPLAKVRKFVEQSLRLQETKAKAHVRSKAKTWERRPAHLGVMKRNGPAAHFATSTRT